MVLLGSFQINRLYRPTLSVNTATTSQELADFGRKTYTDFCQAAGLTGAPAIGPEIVLCVGTAAEIEALRQKWTPEKRIQGTWTWSSEFNQKLQCFNFFLFVIDDHRNPDKSRREVLKCMAASFGFCGTSQEFSQSCFYPNSNAEELSDIDRQLVRCYYAYMINGSTNQQIGAAVEKNWAAMVAP